MADAGLYRGFELIRWFDGVHHDGAGLGVAAVDGTLRTLQDFDGGEVGELTVEGAGIRIDDTVEHEGEGRINIAGAVDAADVDLGVADLGGARDDADAWGERDEVGGALHLRFLQSLLAQDGDGDRHFLQRLGAAEACDNDLFAGRRRGRLGSGSVHGKDQGHRR